MLTMDPSNGEQATILVVDDDELIRETTLDLLSDRNYRLLEAADGEEALQVLEREMVDVILLDILMPGLNGYETCRRIKSHPHWRLIPVVMLTALADVDSRVKALEAGADDFISKPFDDAELQARVRASARVKRLTDQLEDTESILFTLANAVEVKDHYTDQHLKRMAKFSERVARLVGLSSLEQLIVRYGAIMHDIGKIGVSDLILTKPARLTVEEYETIKQHPLFGERIVQPMRFGPQIGSIVREHHERWDGRGYPDGRAGEDIPIGARIVALVDTFDAMTNDRPYRRGLPEEVAIEELSRQAGTQFDPELAALFITHLDEVQAEEEGPFGPGF